MRAPHRPPSRLVVPGAGDAQQPCQRVESVGRAPAVLDLITSSTSGQLDRDTADRLRPRAPPPGPPRSRPGSPARHDLTSRSRTVRFD